MLFSFVRKWKGEKDISSEIEGGGLIVAAVAFPVAAAFGAGWLAWQAGRLLVGANEAVDRGIREKQRQYQEMENQRRLTAQAGRRHLESLCSGILAELDANAGSPAETEALRQELRQICDRSLPEDAAGLESCNLADLARLERIMSHRDRLQEVKIFGAGLYDGLSAAELMEDLRLAAAAAKIIETRGQNVKAADPAVLERARLNQRLSEVSAQVAIALEFVVDLAENYGMSQSNNAWLQSCFNGVDERIRSLCSPAISNSELKKGIRLLEEIMSRYDMLYPGLEREKQRLAALYPVYVDAARALGEPIRRLKYFKSVSALEAAMQTLQIRAQQAAKCAEIYQRLGPAAYMCYAWDEELRAMGYTVHTRRQITEMIRHRPERVSLGEAEMPFYQWDEGAMTQIYSVTPECNLQLIVHPDGSTTMQTIAAQGVERLEEVIEAQKSHCSRIKAIHQRLKENWFIFYDYQESAPAESLFSIDAWLSAQDNIWGRLSKRPEASVPSSGVRENSGGENQKAMHRR